MKKINNFFFGTDYVAVAEYIFFYGMCAIGLVITIFTVIGIVTL